MKVMSFSPFLGSNSLKSGNLYHNIKKNLSTPETVEEDIPPEGKYIGALPKEWILKFKSGSIKENTYKIFEAFSEFAKECANTPLEHACLWKYDNTGLYQRLRGKYRYLEPATLWDENVQKLQDSLEEIFNDKCSVKFIDDGAFGTVFKISAGGRDCALKTYYSNTSECGMTKSDAHGVMSEILNAAHLSNALKPSQCARFYCAKIPSALNADGFMLTGFENSSEGGKTGSFKQRLTWFSGDEIYWGKYKLNDCHGDNFVNGKIIDFGDIEYNFSTKAAQDMAKKFFPMVKSGDIDAVLKFKEENEGVPEFEECMEFLKIYMGEEEDLETFEDFAFHSIQRNLTKDVLEVFRALGADANILTNSF